MITVQLEARYYIALMPGNSHVALKREGPAPHPDGPIIGAEGTKFYPVSQEIFDEWIPAAGGDQ